ncbi:aldehyde dehydrogenase (NAD(P)(+)) ald5 [Rhizophlyctis rosea]|nr:aldehyde dehydrogenase (NAD(P)(+)) ald5 [Rhizophlyctis rosea]
MTSSNTTDVTLTLDGKSVQVPTGLFINNEFVDAVDGSTFETINPNTEEVITHIAEAKKEDVDRAVRAALKALPKWKQVTSPERARLLATLATLIERDAESLAQLESLNNGKPVKSARIDLEGVSTNFRYFGGWADKILGQVIDRDPDHHIYTRLEPYGVVIPWNFPLLMLSWKIAPALAAGNVVVLKTSEKTPLSALKFCHLFLEAGFPPGVINILSGYGPTAGDAIARHPQISKIAFTGSTQSGRKILTAAAETNLKKVSLELGGKSPNIVFPDADLEEAVEAAHMGIFFNQGQCCCAGSRVFVHEGVYGEFVERFKKRISQTKVGNPTDPTTDIGPLVDSLQFDRVQQYIKDGIAERAHLETGGKRVGEKGFHVAPTLFTGVADNMKIAKEEIFGPVVCVFKFGSVEEVIERANDTEYGLAAAVHTRDLRIADRLARELKAGTVWVNTYSDLSAMVPFGGYKMSGFGREGGECSIREYTQVKAVVMKTAL